MICGDCKGSGKLALFTSVEACKKCGGTGKCCDELKALDVTFSGIRVSDGPLQCGGTATITYATDKLATFDGKSLASLTPGEQVGKAVYVANPPKDWLTDFKKAMAGADLSVIPGNPDGMTKYERENRVDLQDPIIASRNAVKRCLSIIRKHMDRLNPMAQHLLRCVCEEIEKAEFPAVTLTNNIPPLDEHGKAAKAIMDSISAGRYTRDDARIATQMRCESNAIADSNTIRVGDDLYLTTNGRVTNDPAKANPHFPKSVGAARMVEDGIVAW